MNKDTVRFQIDQLRQDKIIYAVEAIAVNSAMALCIIAGMFSPIGPFVVYGAVFVGVSYTLFVGIGNYQRLQKIRRLEHTLRKE